MNNYVNRAADGLCIELEEYYMIKNLQEELNRLSDKNGKIAAAYEILFEVPTAVKEVYEGFGLDIAEYNGLDEWVLPVPTVYIINQDGIIKFADLHVDYNVRTEPQTIIGNL